MKSKACVSTYVIELFSSQGDSPDFYKFKLLY